MAPWAKAGLLFSIASFLCAALFSWFFPICLLPLSVIIGLVCGIVTGLWVKSRDTGLTAKEGAKSGLLCGITSLVTTVAAGGVYFFFFGQQNSEALFKLMGRTPPPVDSGLSKTGFLLGGLGTLSCCGIMNVLCFVGCAALGAFLASRFFIKDEQSEG